MDKQRNRRKFFALALSLLLALVVAMILLPAPEESVLVAAYHLSSGHVLRDSDLALISLPASDIPADALRTPLEAVGQTLSMERVAGDILRSSTLGDTIRLQPDERAIAVAVNNASGLGGLLKPGNRVGVMAIISTSDNSGTSSFAKVTVENLRILYISPDFEAQDPIDPSQLATQQNDNPNLVMYSLSQERADDGIVVLAVPIEQVPILYDFSLLDSGIPSHSEFITALELLALLDADSTASLSLYLMPDDPEAFVSAGIFLPNLVVTPGPTPTCNPDMDEGCILATDISSTQEVFEIAITLTPTIEESPND